MHGSKLLLQTKNKMRTKLKMYNLDDDMLKRNLKAYTDNIIRFL